MFQNANPESLNSFTKKELMTHLNQQATLENDTDLENLGAKLNIHTLQWNNTVHFDLTYTPWKHLGYKLAVASLTPHLAKGLLPDYLLLNITTSSKYSLDALEELVIGFFTACKAYKCKARLTDVTTSAVGISMNTTAINTQLPVQSPFTSPEFNTGDLICVSGDLGGAYLGLMLLEREKRVFKENPEMQPDLEGKDYIVGKQLKPHLRTDVIEHIKNEGIKLNSSFGLQNGLAKGILPYFTDNEHGAVLHEDKLPVDTETMMQAIDFGIDPTVAVLDGGEDYELGFIIPQSEYEKLQKLSQFITVIGYVSDQTSDVLMQFKSGKTFPLTELKFGEGN